MVRTNWVSSAFLFWARGRAQRRAAPQHTAPTQTAPHKQHAARPLARADLEEPLNTQPCRPPLGGLTRSHLLSSSSRCLWRAFLRMWRSMKRHRVPSGSRASRTFLGREGGAAAGERGRVRRAGPAACCVPQQAAIQACKGEVQGSPCGSPAPHLDDHVRRVQHLVQLAPDALGLALLKQRVARLGGGGEREVEGRDGGGERAAASGRRRAGGGERAAGGRPGGVAGGRRGRPLRPAAPRSLQSHSGRSLTASFMSSKTSPPPPTPAALDSKPSCAPSAFATSASRPSAASFGRLRRRCGPNVSPNGCVASRLARAALPPTWGAGAGAGGGGGGRVWRGGAGAATPAATH
jgi:hypothetical protein